MTVDNIVRQCIQWIMMGALIWLLPAVSANQHRFLLPLQCLIWSAKGPVREMKELFWFILKGRVERDCTIQRGEGKNRKTRTKRNNMLLMDRTREREVYLDEKQNPISFPTCFSLSMCVCVQGCVHVMSLYWDSLMAVGIVNRRSLLSLLPWRSN